MMISNYNEFKETHFTKVNKSKAIEENKKT